MTNALAALVVPDLYNLGKQALHDLDNHKELALHQEWRKHWSPIFSGLEPIVNRITPHHRDKGGDPSMMDLLLGAGTHTECIFEVPSLGGTFDFLPGDVLFFAGRVLIHGVNDWKGGERICLAHFFKKDVFERTQQKVPTFSNLKQFTEAIPT